LSSTLETTRKAINLRQNPNIAFVIGELIPGDERTIQYEGIADGPTGADLERIKSVYYLAYPDGPEHGELARPSTSGLSRMDAI